MSLDFQPPPPRPAVADPGLTRPDWTASPPRDPALLWLDKNENTDPELSAVVAGVVAGLDPAVLFSYPDLGGLYARLAQWTGVPAAGLRLAAGSDGVIHAVFEAYVAPGDVVLHTVPTFAMYPVYCRIFGAQAVGVAYEPSPDGPRLTADRLCDAIDRARPRLVCLPNPDSPTGTVFDPDALRRIIEAAGQAGALVLIDEAYHPFHPDSVIGWTGRYPHLVVARSTGKAWGMAGLRVGYGAAAPEVAANLHRVRPMYEIGAVSAAVFEAMLDHADAMAASVARLLAGRQAFLAAMAGLGLATPVTHGNFQHVAFGPHAAAVHAALAPAALYRKDFAEPCLKGFSRFSLTTVERFRPVVAAIEAAVGRSSP